MIRRLRRECGALLRRSKTLTKIRSMATLSERVSSLEKNIGKEIEEHIYRAFQQRLFTPRVLPSLPESAPFMQYSTCVAEDFLHPRFYAIAKMLGESPIWHRKQWEWVFIAHNILEKIAEGQRGLGFGVGTEPLTALFASCGAHITATDAPDDNQGAWSNNQQWASAKASLHKPSIIDNTLLDQRTEYMPCDMNAIPDDLIDYDFVWSSCAFEHLGSLEAGMRFVEKSMKTIRSGGIAVHTTEFNLSSNDETLVDGPTVLYRERDMLELVDRLTKAGHSVKPFRVGPPAHFLDTHVDVPPFAALPHLKLRIASHVTTSIGIVAIKGGPG